MEIIMSNQDAILTALDGGICAVEKGLQKIADVSNGGEFTERDKSMLQAANKFINDKDAVAVAHYLKGEIKLLNRLINERDSEISRLQREKQELKEQLGNIDNA